MSFIDEKLFFTCICTAKHWCHIIATVSQVGIFFAFNLFSIKLCSDTTTARNFHFTSLLYCSTTSSILYLPFYWSYYSLWMGCRGDNFAWRVVGCRPLLQMNIFCCHFVKSHSLHCSTFLLLFMFYTCNSPFLYSNLFSSVTCSCFHKKLFFQRYKEQTFISVSFCWQKCFGNDIFCSHFLGFHLVFWQFVSVDMAHFSIESSVIKLTSPSTSKGFLNDFSHFCNITSALPLKISVYLKRKVIITEALVGQAGIQLKLQKPLTHFSLTFARSPDIWTIWVKSSIFMFFVW